MLSLFLGLIATARLVLARNEVHTYGTIAYIRSGETTPRLRSSTQVLTALGAQQMIELGRNFRGRYIDAETGSTHLAVRPIAGMSQARLNPDQLYIQTLDKPHLVASAQAFMQGLYPPTSLNDTRSGPWADAVGLLGNRSLGAVDYPLEGYQYANLQALSEFDYQSIYLNGHEECPAARLESAQYESTAEFLNTQAEERAFYQNLSLDWFVGDVPDQDYLEYRNADHLYESLAYHYTHDVNTFNALSSEENAGVFDKVRYLADQDAWYRYGNVSSDDTNPISSYRAMAGKTLAARVLGRFQEVIANEGNATNGLINGDSQPLTLLFGDYDPMLSFLAIAEVDYPHYDQQIEKWRAIPEVASAMIFELFTTAEASPDDPDNFWVQFSFHNGTDDYDDEAPQVYPLFRNGKSSTTMTWRAFSASMERIMVNAAADWCDACFATSAFCFNDPTVNISLLAPAKSSKVSPVVAGVIGAVVTLAVAGLLFGIAMLLGGIRFHRVERRRKSSLGGFKGSAKLASDADLSLPKSGVAVAGIMSVRDRDANDSAPRRVPHERVGSWELRQKERSGDMGDGSPRGSFDAIEAAMSRPVQPVERV